jgi:hypothetical protein
MSRGVAEREIEGERRRREEWGGEGVGEGEGGRGGWFLAFSSGALPQTMHAASLSGALALLGAVRLVLLYRIGFTQGEAFKGWFVTPGSVGAHPEQAIYE